jgi:hypothetical protein
MKIQNFSMPELLSVSGKTILGVLWMIWGIGNPMRNLSP